MSPLLLFYIIGCVVAVATSIIMRVKQVLGETSNLEFILFCIFMGLLSWYGYILLLFYLHYWKNYKK